MSKTILVIEDEESILELIQDRLKFHNYEGASAPSGEEALAWLKSETADLILLDLMLPKISGLGVLREIKRNEKLSKIPVIVMSALSQEDVVREAMDLGANAYFVKTGNVGDLFQMMNEYLSK